MQEKSLEEVYNHPVNKDLAFLRSVFLSLTQIVLVPIIHLQKIGNLSNQLASAVGKGDEVAFIDSSNCKLVKLSGNV